jgi:hypothetical protein
MNRFCVAKSKAAIAVLIGLLFAVGLSSQTEQQPTKAELKKQKKAAKQAAKDAAREAQRRADTLSFPIETITAGCLVLDNISFHRERFSEVGVACLMAETRLS